MNNHSPFIPPIQAPTESKGLFLNQAGGVIDVVDLLDRNKFILAAGLLGGLLLGGLAYNYLGPVYNSSSQLLVSRSITIPIQESNRSGDGDRSAHIAIIMSPKIVSRAIEDGKLLELDSLKKSKEPVEDILDKLKATRSAGENHDEDNVLTITYQNRSEKDADRVVDAIVASYKSFLLETGRESSGEMLKLIQEANQSLGKELASKRTEYLEFRQSAPLIWRSAPGIAGAINTVTNAHQEQADAIAIERRKVSLKQYEIHSKIESLIQARNSGESQEALQLLVKIFMQEIQQGGSQQTVITGTEGAAADSQLVTLMLEEQALLKNFGPNHPDVHNKQQQMRMLTTYMRKQGVAIPDISGMMTSSAPERAKNPQSDMVLTYIDSMKQQIKELQLRDKELEFAYNESVQKAKDYGHYHVKDKSLTDEIERLESLYSVVEKQLKEVDLVKENKGYRMTVIAPAKSEPDVKRILKFYGGAGFMGFGMVFSIIYLFAITDTTIKSMTDIKSIFHEGSLGKVPHITNPGLNLTSAKQTGLDPMLFYFHQPGSVEAEAYRSIRTTLYVKAVQQDNRLLQVTSAEPADGKSTTISNLAIAMAQSGKRVLLIDADLRNPTIHTLFNADNSRGLSTVLSGQAELVHVTQNTIVNGLTLMTAGQLPDKPAELLANPLLRRVLEQARAAYDVVLVDTPPVLSVSDPCIVAPYTDGLILVVRMQKNRYGSLVRVKETLKSHGIQLVGLIANGADTDHMSYEYKGEYAGNYVRDSQVIKTNQPDLILK
jgi:capsular exopolysaccharide synthesis family protein